MKVIALLLVISLANVVRSSPGEMIRENENHSVYKASAQQIREREDVTGDHDQINSHHNIPRGEWGNDGGDING